MFVCPDCKTGLDGLFCSECKSQFEEVGGIPILLSRDPRYRDAATIGSVYDDVYKERTGVWEDQGRTAEFLSYFSELAESFSAKSVLEIGCGEGFLLSRLRAERLTAVDLSHQALARTQARVPGATSCVALAERLPFQSEGFDLVVSVGVMEHFLDDREATTEIRRVLRMGGHYIALIHVHASFWENVRQKVREYVYPKLRPIALVKWMAKKVIRPISQPIQRPYTRETARKCFEECGFKVKEIVGTLTHRSVPLVGPHVLIFVSQKTQGEVSGRLEAERNQEKRRQE